MIPALVSNSRTIVNLICPGLIEMFVNTSVIPPARRDLDNSPAARLVAN